MSEPHCFSLCTLDLSTTLTMLRPMDILSALYTCPRIALGPPDAIKGRRIWRRQGRSRGIGQHGTWHSWHAWHLLRLCLALVPQNSQNEPRQLPIERSRPASGQLLSHLHIHIYTPTKPDTCVHADGQQHHPFSNHAMLTYQEAATAQR